MQRGGQKLLYPVHVGVKKVARVFPRKPGFRVDRSRLTFPPADGQRTGFGFCVIAPVGIAKGGQIGGDIGGFLGHQILMLNKAGRNFDVRHQPHPARPYSGGVDDDIGLYRAVACYHRRHAALRAHQIADHHAFQYPPAIIAHTARIGLRQAVGVDMAILGDEGRTDQIAGLHQGIDRAGFIGVIICISNPTARAAE